MHSRFFLSIIFCIHLIYFDPFDDVHLIIFNILLILPAGILRYKVDFQSMQLDELDNDCFDLDDY